MSSTDTSQIAGLIEGLADGTVEIVDGTYPGAHFRITMPLRLASGQSPDSPHSKERAHAAA